MDPVKAKSALNTRLKSAGFDATNPSPTVAWSVFKELYAEPLEEPNGVLFESGTYNLTGQRRFHLAFTRQFEVPGSDEPAQLRCEFTRDPSASTESFRSTMWSFEFTTPAAYFAAVEASPAFRATAALSGWAFSLVLDES
jgi:hypothetical protein